MRIQLITRPVRAALRQLADAEGERWAAFCRAIAQFEGWGCHHDTAKCVKRMRRVLNGRSGSNAPRNIDADWVLIACDFFPDSELASLFGRRQAVAQARRELEEAEGEQQREREASPRVA